MCYVFDKYNDSIKGTTLNDEYIKEENWFPRYTVLLFSCRVLHSSVWTKVKVETVVL